MCRLKQQVTKNKKWRDVSSALNIGPSSSAGFTLKKNYGKHLFPFECRYDRGNIDPAPLLAFLDQPSKKESKKAAAERAAAVAGTIRTLDLTNCCTVTVAQLCYCDTLLVAAATYATIKLID